MAYHKEDYRCMNISQFSRIEIVWLKYSHNKDYLNTKKDKDIVWTMDVPWPVVQGKPPQTDSPSNC